MEHANPPAILYHYCSTAAFHSIVSTRSIWLSSLSLANDTMEGRLLSQWIMQHAQEDSASPDGVSRLRHQLDFLETSVEGLAFCVSGEGDLLSQWRGYADDARGFAIGFDGRYLAKWGDNENASMSLEQVTYDLEDQRKLTSTLYGELSARMIAALASKPPLVFGPYGAHARRHGI